ncbi:hypothetical protein K402DRAFT_109094 [Aulographum hederae CBS 113979]|uniref:Uncharacterized protein n=1 Tax=Aulographum hederae CBS 113979 TaxID=1176131 RepID=A0A6G1GWV2_9PEZI|nr:hypothetical protein K402DRAFT_109094 [Aulographum hederae CBS 113979]
MATVSRQELIYRLQGQAVHVPDLSEVFEDWPKAVHPQLPKLRIEVDQFLDTLISDGSRPQKMKQADLGLFASSCWPYVAPSRLAVLCQIVIQHFRLHHEFNSLSDSVSSNLSDAAEYCETAENFIGWCLGLNPERPSLQKFPDIKVFRVIGDELRLKFSEQQRKTFFYEVQKYLQSLLREREMREGAQIASVKEYWRLRMRTCGFGLFVAANECVIFLHVCLLYH